MINQCLIEVYQVSKLSDMCPPYVNIDPYPCPDGTFLILLDPNHEFIIAARRQGLNVIEMLKRRGFKNITFVWQGFVNWDRNLEKSEFFNEVYYCPECKVLHSLNFIQLDSLYTQVSAEDAIDLMISKYGVLTKHPKVKGRLPKRGQKRKQ